MHARSHFNGYNHRKIHLTKSVRILNFSLKLYNFLQKNTPTGDYKFAKYQNVMKMFNFFLLQACLHRIICISPLFALSATNS